MRSQYEHNDNRKGDPYQELNLLSEVRRTPETTQRGLATRLGISLGLTNLLLRNLAHKGYVRVAQANWRRRLYALTPKGMVRRMLLTTAYVSRTLDHYQTVKLIMQEELEPFSLHGESRVAIYGTSEFAELVYLALKELGIEAMDIFALESQDGHRFLGLPVSDVATLRPEHYDRVVIALLGDVRTSWQQLRGLGVAPEQLVTLFPNASLQGEEPRDDA